jgi:methylase of polypeptide subunit release factors
VEHEPAALLDLLAELKRQGYCFVAPTPATHERVIGRRDRARRGNLRDIFGWNLAFEADALSVELTELLFRASLVEHLDRGLRRSRVRVSSLGGDLFVHSAFPTEAEDAVFFGPDSYRFAAFIAAELGPEPGCPARVLDIGTGTGIGALRAARGWPGARLVGTDINPRALRFAAVNAAAAEVMLDLYETASLNSIGGKFDLILANPPYMIDESKRDYRDGGSMHGGGVSLEMARAALPRLAPGGRFLLYTGSAIVAGEDRLRAALVDCASSAGTGFAYREIDPDVFGEELVRPEYADVERIAVVGAVFAAGSGG